ncbi:hypothetical protein D3C71_1779810 [compost metagenome]
MVGGLPLRDQPVHEAKQGGRLGRIGARLAGRQQHVADDALAAQQLLLHLVEVLQQLGLARDFGHALPVADDHRHGGQRRAQFMRGARGQQAHAHDVLFLAGALAHVGQA